MMIVNTCTQWSEFIALKTSLLLLVIEAVKNTRKLLVRYLYRPPK